MPHVEVVPLGGAAEIGKNMTVLRQDGQIVVVDAGLGFPHEDLPGVETVLPDWTFLRAHEDELVAVILTHGHDDHIGALPHFMSQFDVPVIGPPLAAAMAARKVAERDSEAAKRIRTFPNYDSFDVGPFTVRPIHVTHSMPDSYSLAFSTAAGTILVSGDFKFDPSTPDKKETDVAKLREVGEEGVQLLLCECTNAEAKGVSLSEADAAQGIDAVIANAPGRVFVTCFSSSVHRIRHVFDSAKRHGRFVAAAGRSMAQNIETAASIGLLEIPKDIYIDTYDTDQYEDRELVILATGSQGESLAALSQMSRQEYGRLQIRPGDTVIYSARPIPGNEDRIWAVINGLFRLGANVVYGPEVRVHASGHGYLDELLQYIELTKPALIGAVHGEPRHQHRLMEAVSTLGYSRENVIPLENGQRLIVEEDSAYFGDDVPTGVVYVDRWGKTGLTREAIGQRREMAANGTVFAGIAVDPESRCVVGDVSLAARGISALDGWEEFFAERLCAHVEGLSAGEFSETSRVSAACEKFARQYLKQRHEMTPVVSVAVVFV